MPVTKGMDPTGARPGGAATLRGCSGPVLQPGPREMGKRECFLVIFPQREGRKCPRNKRRGQAAGSVLPSPHVLHVDPLEVTHPSALCTSSQPEQNLMDSMILRGLSQLKCFSGSKKSFSLLPVSWILAATTAGHSRLLQEPLEAKIRSHGRASLDG